MKRKGRKYELEVMRILKKYEWTVIDVASNAGLTGGFDCDLLCWPPGRQPNDRWQNRGDENMIEMEVKYRKKATGFTKLYAEHLNGCGLGNIDVMGWQEDDTESGGVVALTNRSTGGLAERFFIDDSAVSRFVESAFKPGVKVVALRASRKPWVFVWRT